MEEPKENKIVEINYQPYIKKKYFFSMTELKFYKILIELIGERYYIFPKVRIADLIEAKYNNKYKWFNKIRAKHVDFLICDKDPISSKAVIELDDSSHNSLKAKTRDKFINEAFANAGIPTIHIRVQANYNKEELIQKIKEAYNTKYTIKSQEKNTQTVNKNLLNPESENFITKFDIKLAIAGGLILFFYLLLSILF